MSCRKPEVTVIVDLMTKRVTTQLAAQGIGIEITDAAKLFLADRGYDPTLGARPLRRAIQRLVEDPMSERLLLKEFRAGTIIVVDVEPDDDRRKQHHLPHDRRVHPAGGRDGRSRRRITRREPIPAAQKD